MQKTQYVIYLSTVSDSISAVMASLEFHLWNEEHYAKTTNVNSITKAGGKHSNVIANSPNITIKKKMHNDRRSNTSAQDCQAKEKYKNFSTDTQQMWNMKCVIILINISKPHQENIQ